MRQTTALLASVALLAALGCSGKDKSTAIAPQGFMPIGQSASMQSDHINRLSLRFGVPIYPGSVVDPTKWTTVEKIGPNDPRLYLLMISPDPLEKVVGYYRTVLNMAESNYGGTIQLRGRSTAGADVTVNIAASKVDKSTSYSIVAVLRAENMASAVASTAPGYRAPNPYGPGASRNYGTAPHGLTVAPAGDGWTMPMANATPNPTPIREPEPAPEPTPPVEETPPPMEEPPMDESPPVEEELPEDPPPGDEPPL